MELRIFLVVMLLAIAYVANAFANPFPKKDGKAEARPLYGVSYSFEQARWYGIDPRVGFSRLVAEVEFDWVRLPFFWDQMVDSDGNLRIDDLKFAIEEAGKRDIKVIVALGAKTPYYPEFHLPEHISSQIKFGETIDANHQVAGEILAIDRKVVEELAGYDNIAFWQVENEPFLKATNNWKIAESLVEAEIEVVRAADSKKRPIILNYVGPASFDKKYKRLVGLLKADDVFGVNAYFKTQGANLFAFKFFGKEVDVDWPKWLVFPVQNWLGLSPDFEGLRKEVGARGIDLWILEMQAEPYVRNLESAREKSHYFMAQDIVKASQFVRASGVGSIGFWGANFWQYRQSLRDDSWIEAVKAVVNTR